MMRGAAFGRVDFVLITIGLALFSYSCLRAYQMSFVHDEGLTYLHYVRAPLLDVLQYSGLAPGNNHLINTLLMKLSASIFGDGELALRLPNVLAHLAYLAAAFLISRQFQNRYLSIITFLLLNTNLFVLDFFSLARGYGLALAFTLLSLLYLLTSLRSEQVSVRDIALSSVFGLLAVLSNIPFLNFYWPLMAVLTVLTISSVPFEVEKPGRALATLAVRSAPLASSALVCMMTVGPPILKLREMEQFFIGGQVGFWDDTVGSLIVTSLYRQPYAGDVRPVIAAGVIAVMVLHLLLSICNLIRGRPFASFERLALLFILVCSALGIVVQHQALGTNYPTDRTALFFIPLFLLGAMYLARELWFSGWVVARRGAALTTALVAGALVIHALKGGSLTHPLLWANDFDTKAILRDLVAQYADSDPKPAQVAVSGVWFFEPTVNFYRVTWKLYWMREYRREQPIGRADYYLLPPQDYLAMRQVRPMSVVRQYELSQIVLAKEGPG